MLQQRRHDNMHLARGMILLTGRMNTYCRRGVAK